MQLPKILTTKLFQLTLVGVICLELLSFASWVYPSLGNVSFFLILIGVVVIGLKDLRIGVGIALVDLLISSHGYLFSFQYDGGSISLRIGLFLCLFILGILDAVKKRELRIYSSSYFWPLVLFALSLVLAFLLGVVKNGFGQAFLDGNGYLFFLLIIPVWQAFKERNDLTVLLQMGVAGLLASIGKVLFILYTFSHKFWWMMPETYKWIRDTRVGEVTEILGSFWRIFFASQIYAAIAFVIIFVFLLFFIKGKRLVEMIKEKTFWGLFLLTSLLFTSTLISLSRSNWVGLICSAIVLLLSFFLLFKNPFKKIFTSIALTIAITCVSFIVIIGTILFPLPLPGDGFSARDIFGGRLTSFTGGEAAVDSRFGLLPPMLEAIQEKPIFGHGFGKTLTYITKDPRILAENPTGEYTTSAFEWGYLELVIKFGLVGVLLYVFFVAILFKQSFLYLWVRRKQEFEAGDLLMLGMVLGGVVLLATHVFSPYINHPLGIGYLIFWSIIATILANAPNKVYTQTMVEEVEITAIFSETTNFID